MGNSKIAVIGSCNTDMVVRVHHLPLPGETIIGKDFMTNQGGKGANQAVAVARLGVPTAFIARVGDDAFGHHSLKLLKEEEIDINHVGVTQGATTGIAMIPVDDNAENSIIVVSGANALLSEQDVENARETICGADILLMQLETPVTTLTYAAEMARKAGVKVVLNPAPYPKEQLPAEFLKNIDIIIPNETEAVYMTGMSVKTEADYRAAIERIKELGPKNAVITAGSDGAYTLTDSGLVHVESRKVKAVDTTAAGDTFCAALCVALSEGLEISEAMAFANHAASITVQRVGAWCSIPKRSELI